MHRAVFTAPLTGAQSRTTAQQALTQTRVAATAETANQIIDDHKACYPPADPLAVFEPLHPDRLGEDLIALSVPGRHPDGAVVALEQDWSPTTITGLVTDAGAGLSGWTAATSPC